MAWSDKKELPQLPAPPIHPTQSRMRARNTSDLTNLRLRSDVAALLATSDKQLRYLLYARPEPTRYRKFLVPKRGGGTRIIDAPQKDLKYLQRKLLRFLSDIYTPRAGTHGFVKQRSIVSNARQHCGKRYVFTVDLEDFFQSINFGRVLGLFQSPPLSAKGKAATVLAQICCHRGVLPQGAPTSPMLSNMICMRLDRQLAQLAKEHNCLYTRYADDITFSKKRGEFPSAIGYVDKEANSHAGDALRTVIEGNGFRINGRKVRLHTNSRCQEVTGLTVNAKCNVHRRFVRQIRAMIHAWGKYGLDRASAEHALHHYRRPGKRGCVPPLSRILRGKLAFVKMVRGVADPVYKNLQRQLVRVDPTYVSVMAEENDQMDKRDFFISHATEDKDSIARPLAKALITSGFTVWYDEYELRIGDSLRGKIDEGLAKSRFGIAILSTHFFAKRWPRRELDGLTACEDAERRSKILPIWHGVNQEEVAAFSPSLAGLVAVLSDGKSADDIVSELARSVRCR